MDNLDLRPKIDLKQQPTVTCSECGSKFFKEVWTNPPRTNTALTERDVSWDLIDV
jgi:hypothetical protein